MKKNTRHPDLLIFDWDGVVVDADSNQVYYTCVADAVTEVGIDRPRDQINARTRQYWGSSGETIVEKILYEEIVGDKTGIDEATKLYKFYKQACKKGRAEYRSCMRDKYGENLKEIPGAIEALGELANNHTLALATAADPEILRDTAFPKLGIDPKQPLFERIASVYDDNSQPKPAPYMIQKIMLDLKIGFDRTTMVGDAYNDLAMGKNAGVRRVAVCSGELSREEAEESGLADIVIENITYLPQELGRLSIRQPTLIRV